MAIQVKKEKGVMQLVVQDEMTIYTALEQKNELLPHLKVDSEVHINLSDVSEIDSAGVQVLMFLKQESQHKNIRLILIQHSQAVVEVLELLNLTAYFGDPIMISADWEVS